MCNCFFLLVGVYLALDQADAC